MDRTRLLLVVFLLFTPVIFAPAQPPCKRPRLDCLGDPLPLGAVARLGTVRLRHDAVVEFVLFRPDGKTVVSAGKDSTVRIWEVTTGKEVRRFTGHDYGIRSLAASPDGKTLASAGYDDTIRIWEAATGKELRRFEFSEANDIDRRAGSVLSLVVALSLDGKTVAAGIDRSLQVLDIATGKKCSVANAIKTRFCRWRFRRTVRRWPLPISME